jgi:hypothetical protein
MKKIGRNKDLLNIIAFPDMNSDLEIVIKDAILKKCEAHAKCREVEYKFYFKWFSLSTYYLMIKSVMFCLINYRNEEKITSYEIDGINLGIPIYSASYRSFKVYESKLYLFYRVLMQFILSTRDYINSLDIVSLAHYVYIKDISYRNNILFDICIKKNIKVFMMTYPYSLVCCHGLKLTSREIRKYEYPRLKFSNIEYDAYMTGRLQNPKKFIPYYSPELSNKVLSINESANLSVLIYAHSFTDAQLSTGYDGFANNYDWIEYTIDNLLTKHIEIIIKGHPNFWAEGFLADVIMWDKKLWKKLIDKYGAFKNVTFIDFPLDNFELLNKLDVQKTIVITHHGNAIVEAAYLGFRSVSSVCSIWGNEYYSFGMTWGSRLEYKKILENLDKVDSINNSRLKNFVFDKYMNKHGYHGPYSWYAILAKAAGITTEDFVKNPTLVSINNLDNYADTVTNIANNIKDVS